jgi:UDP-2,4-diacetamido-2,4,6-trideoxy-beta-L-altropyranose hydrolase
MLIFFRADASPLIGTGHVMRCMTLGKAFKTAGAEVRFICARSSESFTAKIEADGFPVHIIETNAVTEDADYNIMQDYIETSAILKKFIVDYLIVDHYLINGEWEQYVRSYCSKIVVIDDLANRLHDCDFLIDQNLYNNMNERYTGKVSEGCKLLLGPAYALLRTEFYEQKQLIPLKNKEIIQILITFGGSDPTQETERCIRALIGLEIMIHVVVGGANPRYKQIKDLCDLFPNLTFHYNITYMAKLMAESDLAICAGGSSTWERYALGLPGLVIVCASNQLEITEACQKHGIDCYLGVSQIVEDIKIRTELELYMRDPKRIRVGSELAMSLVDACGTNRVLQELLET